MGLSELNDSIDAALLACKPLSIVRGLLFLLRDQTEALENEMCSLEVRLANEPVRKENDRLRAQLSEAFDQIERLQAEVYECSQNRPEKQDDILFCIACLGAHSIEDLSESLDFRGESIHYHLSELEDIDFLKMNHEFEWDLLRDGRQYLLRRGLLKGL